jgi:hypothetical protein
MASPNLGNLTSITGRTYVTGSLPSGSATSASLITNPVASNAVYKINSVTYANISTTSVLASLMYNSASVNYFIADELSIPAQTTLVVMSQDTRFMLEEGCGLHAYASQTASITPLISYEILI